MRCRILDPSEQRHHHPVHRGHDLRLGSHHEVPHGCLHDLHLSYHHLCHLPVRENRLHENLPVRPRESHHEGRLGL